MKRIFTAGLVALGLCQATAWATPIDQWQMIEGYGLTDGYVHLGMTRSEANLATRNGNCRGHVKSCSFRAQDNVDAPVITLTFNAKDRVKRIVVNQNGAAIRWATTRGAFDGMSNEAVQALYPGSTVKGIGLNTRRTTAREFGYSYDHTHYCVDEVICVDEAVHRLYGAHP